MRQLERQMNTAAAVHGDGGIDGPGIDDGLAAIRVEARNLAAAGRNAVQRALSGDSTAFLRSARQQGGE